MKRFLWLVAGLLAAAWTGAACAQVVVVPAFGYSSGIGFEYKGKFSRSGGFVVKGFSAGYAATPFSPYADGPYGYPSGVVQKNVTINIYNPPGFMVPPPKEYDLTGVDLDIVRPDKSNVPATKVNGAPEPGPKANVPPPEMPGKNVSVPKDALRPEDMIEPFNPWKPKVNLMPNKAAEFPKPAAPLANPREESERLIDLGLDDIKEKDYGLAAQQFKKAVQADATNFLGYLLLSQAEVAFTRYGQAMKTIHAAMDATKDYPNLKFHPRLSLYKGMEVEFDDQLALLKQAVKENPKSAELLFLLAHQLWFDQQRDAALELFREARPLTPDPAFIDQFLNAAKPKVVAAK